MLYCGANAGNPGLAGLSMIPASPCGLTVVPYLFTVGNEPPPLSPALENRRKHRILRGDGRHRSAPRLRLFRGRAAAADDHEADRQGRRLAARPSDHADTRSFTPRLINVHGTLALTQSCAILRPRFGEGIMVALRSERRVFLWRVYPRPVPIDAKKPVTLKECAKFLEAALAAGTARAYLSEGGRILEDDAAERDEKSQIYIAKIKRDTAKKTITILINRGDPNAVSPAFINSETHAVRVEPPKDKEAPGYSAHLVISTSSEATGKHRACFEKMPHVSSALVLSLFDRIIARAIARDPAYSYEVVVRRTKSKEIKETRRYRPSLDITRVPSENLEKDLEQGELTSVVLTKRKDFYSGPGAKDLVKRQEEKILIRTAPADKSKVTAFVKGLTRWAKSEKYEEISFHLERLPGGATNNPTLTLDDQDAMEQLYVRAQRLTDFAEILEACYADIWHE